MLRGTLAIALVALTASACSVSRQATAAKSEELKVKSEVRDSLRVEQVMVAVHDTLKEVTTVTVQLNETGDTVKVCTVTDRTRASIRDRVKDVEVKTVVKTDTVYIERRDSVRVETLRQAQGDRSRASALVSALRWVFGILVCVIILIIVFKVKRWFHF